MINWSRIEALSDASTTHELTEHISSYTADSGFDNFGVAIAFSRKFREKNFFFTSSNYCDEWNQTYKSLKNPLFAKVDARVQVSMNKMPAGAWRTAGEMSYTTSLKRCLSHADSQLKKAADFGIRSGLTVPLSIQNLEWGFVTFSSRSDFSIHDLESQLLDAMIFTNRAASIFERIISDKSLVTHNLTNRELEILKWSAVGKTSWEISSVLSISERTVNFHLSNIASKMGVRGRRASCSLAISKGIISY